MRHYSRKKNSTKIFVATTVIAALIYALSTYFIAHSNESVVAKVNGKKIFKSEIEKKLRSVFDGQNQEIKIPEVDNLPKEVIEILVKEIYLDKELTKEAKKSKVTQTTEIKDQIDEAQNKILRQTYVNSLIQAEVTDKKINDKYVELSNDLAGKKEYLVSHIVTKTKEEAEKLLKDLQTKKSSTNKFSELAKKYSIDQDSSGNGGDLGYILEDNMIKEISDAIANLKKDEISAPIQTKFGWHLVKIADIRDAKPLPFESVKDNIRDQIVQDKLNEINTKITKDAKVQILIQLKEVEVKPSDATSAEPTPAVQAPEVSIEPSEQKVEEKKDETQENQPDAKKAKSQSN
jgi:peptidyl-prolyl cis-trans isomerase C